jgi:hypothetical protein
MTAVTDEAGEAQGAARAEVAGSAETASPHVEAKSRPLYWRILRLRHVHPNGWQRAILGEGAIAVAAILVLADRASAWILVVLPLTVALVVKGHDVLAGLIAPVSAGATSYDETATAPPEGDAVVDEEEEI